MIWRIITAVLVCFMLLPPGTALAATDPPDATPTIEDIFIYRHLIEPNDLLLIATYNIPYTSIPDARVDQAYLFRLLDTDNTTVLLTNEAYPYDDKGYNQGFVSLYATAANAPTWGIDYSIQLIGKPSEFTDTSNVTYNYPINSSSYSTFATQSGNQLDLASKVIVAAQALEIAWSITLLGTGDTGIILDQNGVIYFRSAVLGLQVMAPTLFEIQVSDPDYTAENWTNAQATTYRGRFSGTWFGDATQDIADLFGMEFHFIASIPLMLIILFLFVIAGRDGNVFSGLLGTVALVVYGALMGWTPFIVLSISTITIAAFVGYQWFLKSAS